MLEKIFGHVLGDQVGREGGCHGHLVLSTLARLGTHEARYLFSLPLSSQVLAQYLHIGRLDECLLKEYETFLK